MVIVTATRGQSHKYLEGQTARVISEPNVDGLPDDFQNQQSQSQSLLAGRHERDPSSE